MPTASEIVNRACSLIGVKPAGQTISDDSMSDGIETLNDMMLELSGNGVYLQYQVCTASSDETRIPDYAVAMAKANLAVRLAPEYGRPIATGLAVYASESMRSVLAHLSGTIEVAYPDILPIGEDQDDNYINKYFTDQTLTDIETDLGVGLTDEEGDQLEYKE